MLVTKPYDRERAEAYARRWALSRNPLFVDYTGRGGNCTNFVSQAVYAGSCTMNYTPIYGWYYLSDSERAAAWTGVDFFYNFMTQNKGVGPFAVETDLAGLAVGDVIQYYRADEGWYHTVLVVGFDTDGTPLIAAQSNDALDRRLDSYTYDRDRFLHIEGVRQMIPDTGDCYESLIEGVAIIPGGVAGEAVPPSSVAPPATENSDDAPPAESAPPTGSEN